MVLALSNQELQTAAAQVRATGESIGGEWHATLPTTFFEKAGGDPAQARRIAGIASTEDRDLQGDIVLQKGLDWSYFMAHGWFNDNHGKATTDPVGEPLSLHYFEKGQNLPDGSRALSNLHWVEGFLYRNHPPAEAIWDFAQTLSKSSSTRRLGMSLEGSWKERIGPQQDVVSQAIVRNIALTHCPVNPRTTLTALAKSLSERNREIRKALAMGDVPVTDNGSPAHPSHPDTENGRVLSRQALEGVDQPLTKGQAVDYVMAKFPNCTTQQAARLVDVCWRLS